MRYLFDISEPRAVESAHPCHFIRPYLHPTRTMEVHDFIYMVDGAWEIGLENEIFQMKNDDVLILPAHLSHYGIKPCSAQTKTLYFHLYSAPNDRIYTDESSVENTVVLNNFLCAARAPNIRQLFQRIIQTKQNAPISSAYVHTLLYELGELAATAKAVPLGQAMKDYLTSAEHIPTNAEVAARFGISKRSAELIFKEATHSTIHEFILSHKLNEAKQYLRDYPDMKLSALASLLGFYDEYHFSRSFKRAFGISPREFKKQ